MDVPVTFLLLLICCLIAAVWSCPNGCQCAGTKVHCKNLSDFPTTVPSSTTHIYLLNCSFNSLKHEDLTDFSDTLEQFVVSNTVLREVHPGTFNSTLNITMVGISKTELQDLPEMLFQRLQKLDSLVLRMNKLFAIRPSWFSQSKELKYLDLSKNQISYVPAETFHALTKLQYLSIAWNTLTQLFSETFKGLSGLKILRLNKNLLEELPAGSLDGLVNLEELSLQDNLITDLHHDLFSKTPKLQKLFISNNRLTSLPHGILLNVPLLSQMSLYENNLESLGPGVFGPMALQQLWLYDNKLSRVDDDTFRNLTQLRLLVLSRNQISYVSDDAFRGLTRLGEVSLHTNRLTTLQARTFEQLPSLVNISLENNFIASLPLGFLKGLNNLGEIDLRNNSLPNLQQDSLDVFTIAKDVLLQQNPWRCDKDIVPLRNWLKQHPSKVNQTLVVCETPFRLKDEMIAMLTDENLMPVSPTKEPVLTSTEKRRRPHTHPPKQSTPSSAIKTTLASQQENVTNSGQGGFKETINNSDILIALAVVSTVIISLVIIGCVCWKRNRRGNENISQRNRNLVL
ncbi:hypothetical protein ILYODFUR_019605 [Ilyodon furcidens]|uniref:LRRCT domain-containing protein n=1 Tax=Ilyodon furcidens TaxID=33524 RepID=A0ABV0T9G1_9TELE